MQTSEYKQQLLSSIPVISALGVDIDEVGSDFIQLRAPLDKNLNYEGTAFGGSLNTVAILSCYLLTHHLLKINKIPFNSLVIQNSSINYLKPVTEDFYARSQIQDSLQSKKFLEMIKVKKVARIELSSNIFQTKDNQTNPLVHFNGRFIAKI